MLSIMSWFNQRVALMNSLCRICGKEDKKCISVFSESGKKQEIEKKIRICLPLTVEEGDSLPTQICLTCLHKLDATWELIQLCKNGQVLIERKLYNVSENNNRETEDVCCPLCMMNVEEHQLGIGCEGPCLRWYHCSCLNMPDNEYEHFRDNPDITWICNICLIIKKQTLFMIDEKVRSLTEDRPITIGSSAVVTLEPTVEPPPPQEAPPPPVSSTYQVSAPATTVAPSTPAVDNNVYPQGLIQVLQPNKPVLYQQRSNEVKQPQVRRNVMTPMKRSMPTPKRAEVTTRSNSVSRRTLPTTSRRAAKQGNTPGVPAPKKGLMMCKYCNKSFPDDIIDHHVSLHLRQSFSTCLDCNKNFRSELAMSRHRCGTTDTSTNSSIIDNPIDLDPDEEPICL